MNVKAIAGHFHQTRHCHGWLVAAQLLLIAAIRRILVFERYLLYSLELLPAVALPGRQKVHFATQEELVKLPRNASLELKDFSTEDMIQLIARGEKCLVNVVDGVIVGFAWLSKHSMAYANLDLTIPLNQDELYLYREFTLPKFRGQGLGTERYAFALNYGKQIGRPKLLMTYYFDNPSTLTRVGKLGLKRIGTATLIRWRRFQWRVLQGGYRTNL